MNDLEKRWYLSDNLFHLKYSLNFISSAWKWSNRLRLYATLWYFCSIIFGHISLILTPYSESSKKSRPFVKPKRLVSLGDKKSSSITCGIIKFEFGFSQFIFRIWLVVNFGRFELGNKFGLTDTWKHYSVSSLFQFKSSSILILSKSESP